MSNANGPRSREHSPIPDDAEAYENWIQKALAGLQLPHMPQKSQAPQKQSTRTSQQPEGPSIRILLVSDVDLPSASALAEYTLLQNNQVFDASRIDLCIACGPFCRDEDLLPYLKGKSRKQLQHLFEEDKTHSNGNHHHPNKANRSTSWSSVFFRTQEETAAMEGLVTAAISQLESIVCRVVFCPGNTDPMTTSTSPEDLRFTPNSRNVHRQWLPLAPGLGCAGLLFLDAPRSSSGVLQVKPPPGRRANQLIDYDSDEEVDGDCHYSINHDHRHHHHQHHHDSHSRGKPSSLKLTKVHGNDEMGGDSYCKTLEGLIQVAPPPQKNYPFDTNYSQTILVTQYFQPSPTPKRQQHTLDDSDEDDSEDDGDSDTNVYGYQHDRDEDEGEADQQESVAEVSTCSQDKKAPSRADIDEDDEDDYSSTGSNGIRPWPPEHSRFMDSSLVQEHLALEIASGGGTSQRPRDLQKGNVRIVIPGSLRERGEFCLVDMSLMEQAVIKSMAAATASTATAPKKKKSYAWSVRNVEFHNMERLP